MRSESPDNVANLIVKPTEEYPPEPRYVSKYRSGVIRESKRGKSAHKTLGVPSVNLGTPSQFLRKRSDSVPKKLSVRHERYRRPDYQRKLPEWQPIKAADREKAPARSSVDFEKRNVEEAKKLRPSGERMYYVDDRHGTTQPLDLSGMHPHDINRKNYGVPPGRVSKTIERRPARRSSPRRETRGESKSRGEKKHGEDKSRRISPARRAKESIFQRGSERRKSKEHKEKAKDRRGKSKEREDRAKDGKEKARGGKSPKRTNEKIHKSRKKSTQRTAAGETEADGSAKINGKDEGSDGNSQSEEEARESRESTIESDSRTESKTNEEEEQEEEEEEEEEDEEDTRSRSTSVRTKKKEGALTARTMEYQQPRCRYVTEDERAELLYGMKKKWDEMMKEFQGLPFLTDTQPKAKRKSRMEKDLSQLEKDIETIERHPYIYVYSDSEE